MTANGEQLLAELRPTTFAVAYRMLGSVATAEDVVQETLLRVHEAIADGQAIESPRAFAATVATRLSIDELRSARVRRERYVGEWLPEPVVGDDAPETRPSGRDGRLAVAGVPRRAREPVARAARRAAAARRVRLRLRRGRGDRRHERRQRAPARDARAAPRRRPASALRPVRRAARRSSRAASSPRRAMAISMASRRCWPTTSCCTATAAARCRRWPARCTAAIASSRTLRAWSRQGARFGVVEIRETAVNGQPGAMLLRRRRHRVRRDGARHRRRPDSGDPLDRQPRQARAPHRLNAQGCGREADLPGDGPQSLRPRPGHARTPARRSSAGASRRGRPCVRGWLGALAVCFGLLVAT